MTPARETRETAAQTRRKMKLHNIAVRRAKSVKLTKAEYIAQIVKGKYPGISADDIKNEPNPE